MKLEPPWRAPLFTRCSIEFSCFKTVVTKITLKIVNLTVLLRKEFEKAYFSRY